MSREAQHSFANGLGSAWWDEGRAEPEPWGKRTELVPEPNILLGLQKMLAAFPRHRAFAQELATVRGQSSLLESP